MRARGAATLKEMRTGQEREMPLDRVPAELAGLRGGGGGGR